MKFNAQAINISGSLGSEEQISIATNVTQQLIQLLTEAQNKPLLLQWMPKPRGQQKHFPQKWYQWTIINFYIKFTQTKLIRPPDNAANLKVLDEAVKA